MLLSDLPFKFDVLLACLFSFAILLVISNSSPSLAWANFRRALSHSFNPGPFSVEKAYQSYAQYSRLSANEISRKRASYSTLGRAHKRLGVKVGYPQKLDKLKDVTDLNATITDGIAELAAAEFGINEASNPNVAGDLGRVRESLKHFIRDWSEEGACERDRIFNPILNVLRQVDLDERINKKVLVPGSGLGRLAWEISELGFDTTANELSSFMNLAFRFILSPKMTPSKNEHILRPYAHWFSHQRSNDSLFRAISFPDAVPRITPNFRLVETDFLTLSAPPDTGPNNGSFWSRPRLDDDIPTPLGYDYIVTLFFLDTSLNVFATMDQIYALLRPRGIWINLGPLLWTSGGQAKVELSLDEVIRSAEEIGFVFEGGTAEDGDVFARRTVECEYTGDLNSMMRWIYQTEFWVARKMC